VKATHEILYAPIRFNPIVFDLGWLDTIIYCFFQLCVRLVVF